MSALDGSIVNTILPVVSHSFGASVASVEWVITVYLLVISGVLLGFGRLGDMRGHKDVYSFGFVLFVLGSALCGMAPSVVFLVCFRGIQALGAAMLFSNGPAILTRNFPAAQRGKVLGLQATMTYLGLTAGPTLGGFLADALSWRAVFYVNVPVGMAALALGWRFIPPDAPSVREEHFDLAGASVFTVGLVSLLLALNKGHDWGWGSPAVLLLIAVSLVLLSAFLRIERRAEFPMLDLSLFRVPLFSAAAASALMNYMAVACVGFILPFYLIKGRGLSPSQAGLVLSAQPLVMAIASPWSGALSDRIGSRIPATLGMLLVSAGLLVLAGTGPQTGLHYVIAGLLLVGLGSGLFSSPNNSALMGAAPRHRQGIASGVMSIARNMGFALGVGLAGAVFTTVLAHGANGGRELFTGASASFATASAIAAVGAFLSLVRPNHSSA